MDDKYNGNGVFTFREGSTYTGKFVNGNFEGEGVYEWINIGVSYKGGFVLGKFNGNGTISFPDGTKISGTWKNDEGSMTVYLPNGQNFLCQFVSDKNGIHSHSLSIQALMQLLTNGLAKFSPVFISCLKFGNPLGVEEEAITLLRIND